HVGRPGTNRAHAREGAQPIAHLGEGGGDVNRRLFIFRIDIAKFWILKKCLANARDATMAENAEAAGEKGLALTIPLDVLVEQELNNCLGGGEPFGFHGTARR